ncbi:hypothetical protein [Nocardiopsis ganjiahuensis]|uniref:hypothetical protein n=1 Tax=Nocardiopsis ganjiahuensis TaxID=239984 RepID=UPI00034A62DB|nr:hypothetical protein [Nocardiopsis ganjiahuensis]
MNTHLIAIRLAQRGLTPHTIADLVGIHPRQLTQDTARDLSDLPASAIIELARQLDIDPDDLVPGLNPSPAPPLMAVDLVLGALANAPTPLTTDQLAAALQIPPEEVRVALERIGQDPAAASPLALRRVGAQAFRLTPRLDLITAEQYERVRAVPDEQSPLSVAQARALFRVAAGEPVEADSAAVRELQEAGLLTDQVPPEPCEDLAFALDPGEPEVTESEERPDY